MKRVIYWTLLLISSYFYINAQEAVSSETFFAQIAKGQASYVQLDTLVYSYQENKKVPLKIYLEAQQEQDTWFFLVYHKQLDQSSQLLCQCELDSLQTYFQKVEESLREGRLHLAAFRPDNALSIHFFDNHCIGGFDIAPPLQKTPVIHALLNGNLPPPHPRRDTLQLDVQAQMIQREDGQWIVDLEGKLPDSLALIEMSTSQLHYLRSGTKYYYPGTQVPAWKASLVRSGHYTDQLVGYDDVLWDTDLGNSRQLKTKEASKEWNLQFMLAADTPPDGDLEVAGNISLIVSNGSTSTTTKSFSFLRADQRYMMEHTKTGTLFVEEIQQEGFINDFGYSMPDIWRRVVIFEEGGDTLARFNFDEAPKVTFLTTQPNKTYYLQLTVPESQTVSVPFRQYISSKPLHHPIPSPHFQRTIFRLENSTAEDGDPRIAAAYRFYAAKGSLADSMALIKAYDDTGKDLLAKQATRIDWYNKWIDSLDENHNSWNQPIEEYWKTGLAYEYIRYPENPISLKCEIKLWERPNPDASTIYLEGKYLHLLADSTWKEESWKDSLQLGIVNPHPLSSRMAVKDLNTSLLPASWIMLKSLGSGIPPTLQACVELITPINHWSTGINPSQSKLLQVYDNLGYNLLDTSTTPKWVAPKALIYPKSARQEYKPIQSSHGFGRLLDVASFILQTPQAPSRGATQVIGKAQITYNCFDQEEILHGGDQIYYEGQEQIDIELNGHIVTYKRAKTPRTVGGIRYRPYKLQHEDLRVFIVGVTLEDGEEILSPNPDAGYYPYYQLYIPEELEARYLDIFITYAELHSHRELVDFEISIGGTLGQ